MVDFEDGGPAFARPATRIEFSSGDVEYHDAAEGMSLRDYFAGQALASGEIKSDGPDSLADLCYVIADAMIAAREAK